MGKASGSFNDFLAAERPAPRRQAGAIPALPAKAAGQIASATGAPLLPAEFFLLQDRAPASHGDLTLPCRIRGSRFSPGDVRFAWLTRAPAQEPPLP